MPFEKIFPKKVIENKINSDLEFKEMHNKIEPDIKAFYLKRAEAYLKKNEPADDSVVSDEYSIISQLVSYIKYL